MTGKRVPWEDLTDAQKRQFAQMCNRFVDLKDVEEAERYYGDKEQLLEDAGVGE